MILMKTQVQNNEKSKEDLINKGCKRDETENNSL